MLTHRSALRRRTQNPQETTCSAAPRNPTDAVTPRRKVAPAARSVAVMLRLKLRKELSSATQTLPDSGKTRHCRHAARLLRHPHRDSIAVRLGSLRCAQRGARKLHDSRSTDVTGRSTTRSRKAGWSVSFSQQCV